MTAPADSSVPRFYPLITHFPFCPFIIDNCNYGSLFRNGIKMKIFILFTIVYPKINMYVVKTI